MSKLYFEILTDSQKEVLVLLKEFSKYGVLAGGTALALQFFHRKSYDLDIFVPKLISKKFIYKIKQCFRKIGIEVDTGDEFGNDIKDFTVEFIKEKVSKVELQKFFEKEIKKLSDLPR